MSKKETGLQNSPVRMQQDWVAVVLVVLRAPQHLSVARTKRPLSSSFGEGGEGGEGGGKGMTLITTPPRLSGTEEEPGDRAKFHIHKPETAGREEQGDRKRE